MPFCPSRANYQAEQAWPSHLHLQTPPESIEHGIFLSNFFLFFRVASLTNVLFYADMPEKKNKFAEVARAARKGKATAKTTGPSPKQSHRVEEIIILHKMISFLVVDSGHLVKFIVTLLVFGPRH